MSNVKKIPVRKIIGAVISIIILAICTFFAKEYFNLYIQIALWAIIAILAGLFTISILKTNAPLYKISILITYFGAIILIIFILINSLGILENLLHAKSGEDLYNILKSEYGNNLYIVLIVVQFMQVTFIPIASSIVTAAGYYLCGQNIFLTIILCSIGLWLGSCFAFMLGRVFGVKLVKWVAGEKMLLKYNRLVKGKDRIMLDYMFLFPVFPDDVLCMIAGLTTMSWREFLLVQFIARPINVASTVIILHFGTSLTNIFPLNTVWGIIFWIVVVALFVISFILVWKKADKMEKAMTKLISKISGRPVLNDINSIYKIKTTLETNETVNSDECNDGIIDENIENTSQINPENNIDINANNDSISTEILATTDDLSPEEILKNKEIEEQQNLQNANHIIEQTLTEEKHIIF